MRLRMFHLYERLLPPRLKYGTIFYLKNNHNPSAFHNTSFLKINLLAGTGIVSSKVFIFPPKSIKHPSGMGRKAYLYIIIELDLLNSFHVSRLKPDSI